MGPRFLRSLAAALASTAALAAQAHDTWLTPARAPLAGGSAGLELATGNRYPRAEYPTLASSVKDASCVDAQGQRAPLAAAQAHETWLDMALPSAPLACGVDLHLSEVVLDDAHVGIYFRDIQALPRVREAWAALHARGVAWREHYRKNARIELAAAADASPQARARSREPLGLPLEFVLQGDAPVQTGKPFTARLLRQGAPLAGQPVEVVSERNPLGLWLRTDDNGLVTVKLPFGGAWILRTVDLRAPAGGEDTWNSDFATLALEAR